MSVHQDCRMYEHKFPEVDDVVMVQVCACCCWAAANSLEKFPVFDRHVEPLFECLVAARHLKDSRRQ